MIINLISCPRTISTALMYSFAQRTDMLVFDEPFYGVYLWNTGYNHPGKDDILTSMSHDEDEVFNQIHSQTGSEHLFIKNMASHYKELTPQKFDNYFNVFLIRNPLRIITSYSKVIKEPTTQDIGITRQATLYRRFEKKSIRKPLVIDSNDVLDHPELHLKTLCQKLGLIYEPQMLSWSKGPKKYDGIWAPYWYKNVHRTTGFEKQPTSEDPLPDHLEGLYHACLKDYQFLYEKSITHPGYAPEV